MRSNSVRFAAWRCAAFSAVVFLAGCAVNRRPATTLARLELDAAAARAAERVSRDSVIERLVRRAEARGDRTLDILMLSGGGQNGAFGVGFMRGWQSRADAPMPRFDLITGISTGALQAPYALLGTAAAMDSVSAIYARSASEIAPTLDWWFLFRRTGGLVNTERFDRTLEKTINGQFSVQIRKALAEDRQLIFGTSDFDLGIGRTWSMSETLDTSSAGLARTRSLLKAATAIPGIFPPVVVDGHVHADGGVITNVLTLFDYEDYQRLAGRLAARGMRDVNVRVWVVMNLWTHAETRVTPASNRGAMSGRSTAMLFYAHMPETLAGLTSMARAVSATVPGLRLDVKVALPPAWLATEPGGDKLFDRAFMLRLDEFGFAKSRSATPWDDVPSAYSRPVRVP